VSDVQSENGVQFVELSYFFLYGWNAAEIFHAERFPVKLIAAAAAAGLVIPGK
jgi:hypothetical protein